MCRICTFPFLFGLTNIMLYIDKKYVSILSSKFDGFKWKSNDLANCRCPLCGDSKQNKTKKRGYWYPRGDSYWFSCHNCGQNQSLRNFLKSFDYPTYEDYNLETYKESHGFSSNKSLQQAKPEPTIVASQLVQKQISPYLSTKKLLSLPEEHPAYLYVISRKIPFERLEELYYTPKFFKWASEWKEQFEDIKHDHPRLIIPFRDQAGNDIGFSARCFGPEPNKYIMIKFDPLSDARLQYGMDRVNTKETVYCVEGPVDSMFVTNCVASCNAALHTVGIADILIYDNQPRNREVVDMIDRGIETGKAVVIWPSSFVYKDINEAVMAGEDVQSIIDENTYYGLELKLKFTQWKKL